MVTRMLPMMALCAVAHLTLTACDAGCPPGTSACAGGPCIRLNTVEHCGACGRACAEDEICGWGDRCECPGATTRCDGECVFVRADVRHCGRCGASCGTAEICDNATCACANGYARCLGTCIDVLSDPLNCGGCDVSCSPTQTCSFGTCGCEAGLSACGSDCIDLDSDVAHCGACDSACGAGQECASATCRCLAGALCGSVCRDVRTDPGHCGGCGRACALAGSVCEDSRCIPQFAWADSMEGTRHSWTLPGTAVAIAPDGDVIAAWTHSTSAIWTRVGVVVTRYSSTGDLRWRRTFDRPASMVSRVAVDGARVAIGVDGATTWSGAGEVIVLDHDTGADIFLRDYGDGILDLAFEGDGSLLVAGAFSGTITLGTETFTAGSLGDRFVARLDADGAPTFAMRFAGPGPCVVATEPSGDFYLACRSVRFGSTTAAAAKFLMGRFGPDGALRWTAHLDYDTYGVAAWPEGVAVFGRVSSGTNAVAGLELRSSAGNTFLVGIDAATGLAQWGGLILGSLPRNDIAGGLVHHEGRLYLSTNAAGRAVTFPDGTRLAEADAYVAAVDVADGSVAWAVAWNVSRTGALIEPQDIAASSSTMAVVGWFDESYDFGGPAPVETAGSSMLVVAYDL